MRTIVCSVISLTVDRSSGVAIECRCLSPAAKARPNKTLLRDSWDAYLLPACLKGAGNDALLPDEIGDLENPEATRSTAASRSSLIECLPVETESLATKPARVALKN